MSQHPYSRTADESSLGRSTKLWLQFRGESTTGRGGEQIVCAQLGGELCSAGTLSSLYLAARVSGVGMLHAGVD
jgi:hypothetical protein